MRTPHPEKRTGFTLVEMLVVIAIIGIMAAILVPTLGAAIRRAKIAAIAAEVSQLSSAIEAYKAKFGDYPPDFSNLTAVQLHVKSAFPRNTLDLNPASATGWFQSPPWKGASGAPVPNPTDLDQAEALVFWLSAIKNDPRNPLNIDNVHPTAVVDGPGDPIAFFPFDEARLTDVDNDGWPEYAPQQAPQAPYVYFDGRLLSGKYIYDATAYTNVSGIARPYRTNTRIDARDNNRTQPQTATPGVNDTQWIEAGKFQIVCAGLDSDFGPDAAGGVFKQFPDPNYTLDDADLDNLGSFSDAQTIGDSVP